MATALDWDHRWSPIIVSPFILFGFDYNADIFGLVAPLGDDIEIDAYPMDMDHDWEMDCQDVHDVIAMLEFTGNLDAPLL